MKRLIYITIVALLGCMALTSCVETGKKGERLTTELCIKSSQDLIDVCDIEVTYKGKGGVNMTDTITSTKWKKTIINDSFPTKIGIVTTRYLLKPGVRRYKGNYSLACRFTITTLEEDFETDYYDLRLEVPSNKVDGILDLMNYFKKDAIQQEADPKYMFSGVATVFRDKSTNGKVKFYFGSSNCDGHIWKQVPVGKDPETGEVIYEIKEIEPQSTQ